MHRVASNLRPLLRILLDKLHHLGLRTRHVHCTLPHFVRQPALPVVLDAPLVHICEHLVTMVYRQLRTDDLGLQLSVRDHHRDLQDRVLVHVQARHLQVDPDQRILQLLAVRFRVVGDPQRVQLLLQFTVACQRLECVAARPRHPRRRVRSAHFTPVFSTVRAVFVVAKSLALAFSH